MSAPYATPLTTRHPITATPSHWKSAERVGVNPMTTRGQSVHDPLGRTAPHGSQDVG
ncbi:MAG: hypothetical protein ABJA98_06740 [Acidobacteriota bacterium]